MIKKGFAHNRLAWSELLYQPFLSFRTQRVLIAILSVLIEMIDLTKNYEKTIEHPEMGLN